MLNKVRVFEASVFNLELQLKLKSGLATDRTWSANPLRLLSETMVISHITHGRQLVGAHVQQQ